MNRNETDTNFSTSLLRIYSLAVVVKDKEPDSNIAIVTPLEHLSNVGENLSTYEKPIKKALDDWERVTKVNITKRVRHEAEWYNIGNDNRVTPPDLCEGEMVILYRMADEERFHWVVKEKNYLKRKLEHVVWQFNNTPETLEDAGELGITSTRTQTATGEHYGKGGRMPNEPVYQFTKENVAAAKAKTYWFEVSTRDKHILLQTSDNDNEVTIYQIKLDTEKGVLSIRDSQKNSIVIDSLPRQITLTALDVNVEANLWVRGNVNVNNNFKIEANTGNTWVGGGLQVDDNALVKGDVTTKSNLYSKGMSFLHGNVSMGTNANVAKTLTCGAFIVTGPLSALGSAAFGGGGGSPGTTFDDRGSIASEEPADFKNSVSARSMDVADKLTAADADVAGEVKAGSANVAGAMKSASAEVSGAISAASAEVSGAMKAASADVSGAMKAASADVSGAINAASAEVTGTVKGAVGEFADKISSPTIDELKATMEFNATTAANQTLEASAITAIAMDEMAKEAAAANAAADVRAQAIADEAANTAATNAATAATAAAAANSAGAGAQHVAETATAAAQAAQGTADAASAAASTAQNAANAAQGAADAAQNCCDTHSH